MNPGQNGLDFRLGRHDRQLPRDLDRFQAAQPRQFRLQHLAVQEVQRALRLVLRGSGDHADDRQMSQKGFDLLRAHLGRVPLAVEEDKAAHPLRISPLRSYATVLEAERTRSRSSSRGSVEEAVHAEGVFAVSFWGVILEANILISRMIFLSSGQRSTALAESKPPNGAATLS